MSAPVQPFMQRIHRSAGCGIHWRKPQKFDGHPWRDMASQAIRMRRQPLVGSVGFRDVLRCEMSPERPTRKVGNCGANLHCSSASDNGNMRVESVRP